MTGGVGLAHRKKKKEFPSFDDLKVRREERAAEGGLRD